MPVSSVSQALVRTRLWLLPLLVTVWALGASGCSSKRNGPGAPPNVLIIVIDTLRYDATGLPSRDGATPFLESLAAKGVEFATAYSTYDWTAPSHFSLLTGFVRGQYTELDRVESGMPHQLRRLGYAAFGVSANPNLQARSMSVFAGFERFVNLYDRWKGMTDEQRARLSPVLDERIVLWGGGKNDANRTAVYASAERVTRNLMRFIRETAPNGRPFFAFANIMEPHDPYFPDSTTVGPDECRRDLPDGFEAAIRSRTLPDFLRHPETIRDPARRKDIERRIAVTKRPWALADDLTPAHLAAYRCRYDAEVREADRDLARLFELLAERKLLDSTIVVITSDHGESFGEKGFVTHKVGGAGDVEANQRVPLLFLLPPRFRAQPATVKEPVTIADVAPTLYDLMGIDWRPLFTAGAIGNVGRSLCPELGVRPRPAGHAVSLEAAGPHAVVPEGTPPPEVIERLRDLGYVE
jgi:arylsulfatase A-like enzyme